MQGPPLPVVVQCQPGQDKDLNQLIQLVKNVPGGGSNVQAEAFVKGVIEIIQDTSIWPGTQKFYVAINGVDMPKYIAQEWKYVMFHVQPDLL